MSRFRLSPLRDWELARAAWQDAMDLNAQPAWKDGHAATTALRWAERDLVRARRRLILSALAYIVVALAALALAWLLIVLAVAAFSPTPALASTVQLPTI